MTVVPFVGIPTFQCLADVCKPLPSVIGHRLWITPCLRLLTKHSFKVQKHLGEWFYILRIRMLCLVV